MKRLGIDIGSTTVKVAVIDEQHNILFSDYQRHFAKIQETLSSLLKKAKRPDWGNDVCSNRYWFWRTFHFFLLRYSILSGSCLCIKCTSGLCTSDRCCHLSLVVKMLRSFISQMGSINVCNGVCAGGTGSFIDQMASLLQTDASGLNEYAKNYKALYTIAARCGVFAKTDIQPLLIQGADRLILLCQHFTP